MNKDSFNVYRKEFPLIYLFLGVFSKFFIYQDLFLLFQLIYQLINFNWFENIYYMLICKNNIKKSDLI